MIREWPEKGVADFEALVVPLREAQQRLRDGEPADYEGYGIPSFLATTSDIDETLTRELLKYHEERGRDTDTVVLLGAVRRGIEQGIRHQLDKQDFLWHLLRKLGKQVRAGDLLLARMTMESVMAHPPLDKPDD